MKIHGTTGMSAENIRDEVNRGGRLIIYTYCISVFVMTFKRSTDIRLIKAGHGTVGAGLPFTLVSLLFGWWGFPWGPIYTIETIYRNLCGGIDVTDEVIRALLPAAAASDVSGAAPASAPTLRAESPAPSAGFNYKAAILMVGAAAILIVGGVSFYCYNQSQHLTVLLVSGLDRPYSVSLNGVEHRLGANGHKILTLPEGEYVLQDAPGGNIVGSARTLKFSEPFFDHLGKDHVAIINPDRAAILVQEDVPYYNTKMGKAPDNENTPYSIFANQESYFIDKADYVLEKSPESISMPSGTSRLVKTRLQHVNTGELPGHLNFITGKLGYPAAREHLMILGRQRSDESLLYAAVETLKQKDQRAFFLLRLKERPVLIDWHRVYQSTTERTSPEIDLEKEYREYVATEPDNGALIYLLGRVIPDSTEARKYFQQALSAASPCPYAHNAFAYDAYCNGDFAKALDYYRMAESAGVPLRTRSTYRRHAAWGLHQYDSILAEIRTERKAEPTSLTLAAEEISATLASGQAATVAEQIKTSVLNSLKKAQSEAKDLKDAENFLQSVIAYQTGQLATYVESISHFDYPYYKFCAALTKGELESATRAALEKSEPQVTDMLLLYLLAKQRGDEVNAEKHFTQSLELMKKGSKAFKQAAALLTAPSNASVERICDLPIDVDDKFVLLTALGLKDPAHKAAYHALAAKLDFMPDFPHQFIHGFLQPKTSVKL